MLERSEKENCNQTVAGNLGVCICTRNRPDELERCLLSVLACGKEVNEIIVSDDSTDTRTAEMIRLKFPVAKYVTGPKKGLGANRNCAIDSASSMYLIFLDDDSEIDPGFVAAVDELVAKDKLNLQNTMVTGNQIEDGVSIKPHDQSFLGFQNVFYQPGEELNTVNIMATVFPRSMLSKVRFDDLLVYGYDEVDVCARCRHYGAVVKYCDKANVYHYPSVVNRDYYSPYTESSRIYVTFKRYYMVDNKRLKSWIFLFIAMAHLLLSRIKHEGFCGIKKSFLIGVKALGYIRENAKSSQCYREYKSFFKNLLRRLI
ncbi:glycosyltransferase [Acidithiobacillus thiooxidans]|uniref:Glycosyltransferase 2-like domain-containing protein n=1 Tax=Acidithiobacillus thiooxidans ATCC 19377 TaxID=637390 RepID=A0A5P9XTY3_ACITH|nr:MULTISPECIES: glycosyltransferase [Acidithiobacillus]MBU2740816.1 glycosyltransferase [Acidithiobacillus albertensis]MBU2834687.1 glycosyltransferase [Acidithiobacillus thiooxidans]MDA8177795.1 glycosyltransferase [Acidithiobacillus sp.]QFX97119.1 hypothetical protein GCD22_02991 [Acidithiobacillus thiooxidans ATCC 19377]